MATTANLKRLKTALDNIEMIFMAGATLTVEDYRAIREARKLLYTVEMRWDDIEANKQEA